MVGQRERLSEGNIMYCVYWIRQEDHTDIDSEGYVGITKDFSERMKHHRLSKRFDWDHILIEIVQDDLSQEQALNLEFELRPTENIGWNRQRGGFIGVDSTWYDIEQNRQRHSIATSEATKRAIELKDSRKARSERAKLNWINNRENYKNVSVGSNNPKAILNESQVREIKYQMIPSDMTNTEIAKIFGVKHYVISFIRSGKNWSHI